jgi:RNA-binding protein YhbY
LGERLEALDDIELVSNIGLTYILYKPLEDEKTKRARQKNKD